MIDGIKISTTKCDFVKLLNSNVLNFQRPRTDLITNEVIRNKYGNASYITNYKSLFIKVTEHVNGNQRLWISGSLHKFHNQGKHNYDDFTYNDLCKAVHEFCRLCYINPEHTILHNLEVGVNINPPENTSKVLRGLIMHKMKVFEKIAIDYADYYQVKHNNFYLKLYDKALQYRRKGFIIPRDILRFEYKYIKMSDLVNGYKSKDVNFINNICLKDLLNLDFLVYCSNLLVKKWNEIIFYDHTISNTNLKKSQRNRLNKWQNVNYWIEISKQERYNQNTQLKKISEKHSNHIKLQVTNLISNKLNELVQNSLPIDQCQKVGISNKIVTKDINTVIPFDIAKILPINTIYKVEIGNKKTPKKEPPKNSINCYLPNFKIELLPGEKLIPDYNEFHNDPREIPF